MGGESHAGCAEILDEICAYMDGDLGERRARDLLAHMEGCAPCQRYLESVLATRGALAKLGAAGPCGEEDREALKRCLDTVLRKIRP